MKANKIKIISARQLFAKKMKAARLQMEISQEELADLCGLHRTYIGSIERCERNVSIDNMEKIAIALGKKLAELVDESM